MLQNNIKQFVAWGHKLHSHTHSYIHGAFIKAFTKLGYKTLWLDDSDDISGIDFEGTIFLTEGRVDNKIPIRNDCYYILHNCDGTKYKNIPKNHKMGLQVYTDDVIKCHGGKPVKNHDGCFYLSDCLFIPWATDLFPEEINENIRKVRENQIQSKKMLNFVGMGIEPWDEVEQFCKKNGIQYKQIGGFSRTNVDFNENVRLIQESIVAPAVQCKWQVDNSYIPCRIFKNISYGKMGMTNNLRVYELFGKRILYNTNINDLMKAGLDFENKSLEEKNSVLIPLMEYVRDSHTYLNRVELIFWYFNNIIVNN